MVIDIEFFGPKVVYYVVFYYSQHVISSKHKIINIKILYKHYTMLEIIGIIEIIKDYDGNIW